WVWNWPVLPVMPWVMTLVSLLIRIDMWYSLAIVLFGSGYDFGSGFSHGVVAAVGRAGFGQLLLAEFFVGALHAHNKRHTEVYSLACSDNALGDNVATHDAAEDINQNGFDAFVLKHDLEGFGHFFGRSATANVEEVGGLAAKQLD